VNSSDFLHAESPKTTPGCLNMRIPANPAEPSTVEEQLENAVEQFRAKQKQSDDTLVAWMQSNIKDIERATNAKDKKNKQKDLASYWGCGYYSDFLDRHCTGDLRNLLPDEQSRSASTVKESLPEPQRKEFLEHLQTAINRFYDEEDPEFKPIHLPEEYCVLLSIANGIRDIDIRRHGICGIDDISRSPLNKVVPEPEKLPCHRGYYQGWDIDVGFILGRGQPEHDNYLVYAYCARKEVTQYGKKRTGGEIEPHERVWRWRLFYREHCRDRNFVFPMIFELIVDWRSWYQEWYNRS